MKVQNLLQKNKYSFFIFSVFLMLSLIYDGFDSFELFACRIFLCIAASVFFSATFNSKKENASFGAFAFLSVISCNTIFLTSDIHILLSLSCFLLALFFEEKIKFLTPVFAGFCVLSQPLTVLFFVPTIIITLIAKKQKLFSALTLAIAMAAFGFTKFAEQSEFYLEQFSSYHLSIHLIYFSNNHLQTLAQFFLVSAPLAAVAIASLIRLIMKKKIIESVLIFASVFLSLFAFALSKNTQTVFMILIPIFASFITLQDHDAFKETTEETGTFFLKHLLLFLCSVTWTAGYPLVFGAYPYDSEFFSKATFVIFRQE